MQVCLNAFSVYFRQRANKHRKLKVDCFPSWLEAPWKRNMVPSALMFWGTGHASRRKGQRPFFPWLCTERGSGVYIVLFSMCQRSRTVKIIKQ